MKTQTSNGSIDRHHTFAKRWMITATAIYGLMLIGLLAVVATGSGSDDKPEASSYSSDARATPAFQPGRLEPSADTIRRQPPMAINKAAEPAASPNTARLAPVPVPEVDEMAEVFPERAFPSSQASTAPAAQSDVLVENGWDFNAPDSIPGFGSMPQPGDTPSPDGRRLARTNR